MRTEATGRGMSARARSVSAGSVATRDEIRQQAVQARNQARMLEAQLAQEEVAAEEQAIKARNRALFRADLNETGQKVLNGVRRIERELNSIERERREMEQLRQHLEERLQVLSALRPDNWSDHEVDSRIREALPILDQAENDIDEYFGAGLKFRHTHIFDKHIGEREEEKQSSKRGVWGKLADGFFFHLPLYLIGIPLWYLYQYIQAN